ncbi:MAG: hypothetical protein LBU80_06310 [Rikenellaceae bacterium]|nr:hypothetical protein [Rikenellaceae bacterium]
MKRILIILSIVLLTSSNCKKRGGDPVPSGPVTPAEINGWIYEQMKHYYYWSSALPEKYDSTDMEPAAYFQSLCYLPPDRFSYVEEIEATAKAVTVVTGNTYETDFGFSLRPVMFNGVVSALQVLFVVPGSPADLVGIRRGDLFSHADGKPITNVSTYGWNQQQTVILTLCDLHLDPIRDLTLSKFHYLDHPVLADSVYEWGAYRVAYLVYKNFRSGGDNIFIDELKERFAWFKHRGANALVLDLRYNNGGEINAAQVLASLIAPRANVEKRDIFARLEFNATYGSELRRKDIDAEVLRLSLPSATEINNLNLNLNKLCVITGNETASASELIIHCLKDFLGIVIYGERTVGKNLGSITVTDNRNRIPWKLHPIVTRISDSKFNHAYETGISPTYPADEKSVYIGDFGDVRNDPIFLKIVNNEFPGVSGFLKGSKIPQLKSATRIQVIDPPFQDAGIILDY